MSNGDQHQGVQSSSVPPGTQLNNIYEIDTLIAYGGMGEVFRGHNIQTGDPVAIKIVLPEFARDQMILDLFRKEARILNHLAHDAIVRYYVFSIDAGIGRPYLAMEYVDGPSLAERIKSGPLSTDDCIYLQRRLADGLQKAHDAGIIHRDMSPDNVILPGSRVDRAKIIDFGIAKSANVGGTTLLGGSFAGKYNFVSPEQLGLFGGDVTPRSDIYSLGLVLAAALRGQPFDMSGSQVEVIEKRRVIPDLTGIDPRMRDLLRAMLEPDPARRLASMSAVRDWAPEAARGPPLRERTVLVDRKEEAPARAPPPPPRARAVELRSTKPVPAERRRRGGGLLAASLAIAAIAAGAFGAWYFVQTQSGAWYGTTPEPSRQPEPQEEIAGGKPAEEGPDQPEQQAAIPPAPKPVEPSQVIDRAAQLVSFIETYNGGDCFFAAPEVIAEKNALIVGYGNHEEAFDRFLDAFKTKAGFEPDIRMSKVSDNQCAVVDALRRLTTNPAGRPKLQLDKDVLPTGSSLQGSVTEVNGRRIEVLLVDHEGIIQNLRSVKNVVTDAGNTVSFKIRLSAQQALDKNNPNDYLPMLILSVASTKPVDALANLTAAPASQLLPTLAAEAARSGDVATTMGYFKLVGSGP